MARPWPKSEFAFECIDCFVCTKTINEYYILHRQIWPIGKGMLCIGCVERRIGRQLQSSDFLWCGANHYTNHQSDRLRDRLGSRFMLDDYLSIGSTPPAESCVQVGVENYDKLSRIECDLYIGQLQRQFGKEPEGCILITRSFPHDFGSYREVICKYDPDNEKAVEYAFNCESSGPMNWDEQSKSMLRAYHAKQQTTETQNMESKVCGQT